MTRDELRNALADLAHIVWSEWWKYQRSCSTEKYKAGGSKDLGSIPYLVIPPTKVKRWDRQARTNMVDLPPDEAKSDFEIADKYLDLVDAYVEDMERDWSDLIESLGYVPWLCDVCGKPGVKSVGAEGYCHKHAPGGKP